MTSPADALEEMMVEARKRSRREMEEEEEKEDEEEGLKLADLPAEMQMKLIETIELPHAGVDPAPHSKLERVDKMWRMLHRVWIERRSVQAARPESLSTLSLARLFVSPRWKLITHMNWNASSEILRAFTREKSELLVFFRTAGWFASVLGKTLASGPESLVRSTILTRHAPDRFEFETTQTTIGVTHGSGTEVDALDALGARGRVGAALIYGFAINMIDPRTAYSTGAVTPIFLALRRAFFGSSSGEFKPEMLAWQDKMVAMRVVAEDPPPPRVLIVYDVAGAEETVEFAMKPEHLLGNMGQAVDAARSAGGPAPEGGTYLRTAIGWHTDETTVIHEAGAGWGRPPDTPLPTIVSLWQKRPQRSLRVFHPNAEHGWSYDGSMFVPEQRGPGLLILPLPWLFYLCDRRISLTKAIFVWSANKTLFFNLVGGVPLDYAPYDLVWLPDSLPEEDLETLALLQRRDLRKRATARVPDVVPL